MSSGDGGERKNDAEPTSGRCIPGSLFSSSRLLSISSGQNLAPLREDEPVVVRGRALAAWLEKVDRIHIALYALQEDAVFDPIPFRSDKRR